MLVILTKERIAVFASYSLLGIFVASAITVGCSDDHIDQQTDSILIDRSQSSALSDARPPSPIKPPDPIRIAAEYIKQGKAKRLPSQAADTADEDHWIRVDAAPTSRERHDTFGDRQLQQVLIDRPDMKGIVRTNDFIYRWVVKQFNSLEYDRVQWDPREPKSGAPAEHQSSRRASSHYIRVTSAEAISGRDKWLMLVFELHNYRNKEYFDELWDKAIAGSIRRDEYATGCVKLEFRAMVATQEFFRHHPIPGASPAKDPYYTGYFYGSNDFEDYKEMLDLEGNREYDPRDYYGKSFDSLTEGTIRSWVHWWNSTVDL